MMSYTQTITMTGYYHVHLASRKRATRLLFNKLSGAATNCIVQQIQAGGQGLHVQRLGGHFTSAHDLAELVEQLVGCARGTA